MSVMSEVPQHVKVLHSNFLIFCTKQQSAESLISDIERKSASAAGFALRVYLMSEDTRKSAMKNKKVQPAGGITSCRLHFWD